jgi:hypothetical protein
VLTKVGHTAEQPPPRKETVRAQTMQTVIMIVVGRLGQHVYVYKDDWEPTYHVALR